MAGLRKNGPYIWVTRLLVGENSCEWAAWFRAQHESWSWERVFSGLDQVSWQMAHTGKVASSRHRPPPSAHPVSCMSSSPSPGSSAYTRPQFCHPVGVWLNSRHWLRSMYSLSTFMCRSSAGTPGWSGFRPASSPANRSRLLALSRWSSLHHWEQT